MKKIIPFITIICLLLTSCQLKTPVTETYPVETSSEYTAEHFGTTEYSEILTETETQSYCVSYWLSTSRPLPQTTKPSTSKQSKATTKQYIPSTNRPLPQSTQAVPSTAKPVQSTAAQTTAQTTRPQQSVQQEFRAIWISCYDHISAKGKTKAQYAAETDKMFANVKSYGFNTAFVHLRAFSDAFYKSDIYPYSAHIAGTEGADLPFDPFEVMLSSAAKYGISVHGWINPFRVSTKKDTSLLSSKNPAKALLGVEGRICVLDNGIYYNPSSTENHALIIDGVREILDKYSIDGIHIDDYFYPSTDKKVDSLQYGAYTSQGGTMSLSQWRTANVNAFVSALYSAVKAKNSNLIFSISPSGKLEDNKTIHYADCERWLSQKGYADMIIPQIYYGFQHETLDFEKVLKQWASLPRDPSVKLVCGIASYKCGTEDKYAGKGKTEWKTNSDILARQTVSIRNNSAYCGLAMFSYSDLTKQTCAKEMQNYKQTINTGNSQ